MFSFSYTTKDFATGLKTVHVVVENVYSIGAAWDRANERVDTIYIDPRP